MKSDHLSLSPSIELEGGGQPGGFVSTSRTWALILRECDSAKADTLAMKNYVKTRTSKCPLTSFA